MSTSENDNSGGNNSSNSEDTPFAVGSNITLQLPAGTNPSSDSSEPFAVGTNMTIQFTDDSGQPQGEQLSSDNIVGTNSAPWGERDSSGSGDSLTGSPTSDSSYTWDFSGTAGGGEPTSGSGDTGMDGGGTDGGTGVGDTSDLDSLFQRSPWGRLDGVGEIDGFEDIFGNVGASAGGGENPFGGGGAGGGENPFGGGGAGGGENPFGGGGNPFGGGGAGGFM